MYTRFGRPTLAFLLLAALAGACSDSSKPPEVTSGQEVTQEPVEQSESPIDPSAIAFLEVTFLLKGTDIGVPNVPFSIRWEEDGKPSSTDANTTPEGTRRIQFDHGARFNGLVIHPSATTAPSFYQDSALLMGGRTHEVTVELEPGGIVSGTVVDIEGKPIADAVVGAYFLDAIALDRIKSRRVDSFTHTDADGKFRLGGFPSGPFMLEASAPNQVSVWRPGGLMKDAREYSGLEIQMEPGFVVYGQAVDSQDRPIAGVHVTAGKPNRRINRRPTDYPDVFMHGPRACIADSDEEGLFTLEGVPESQGWNINGKHPEYQPVRTSFAAGQQDVWLEMTRGALLTGTISATDGAPVVGAQVWVLSPDGEPSVFTDRNGEYVFGLGKDRNDVCVLIYKHGLGMKLLGPMDITAETGAIDIVLDGGAVIRGRLVDASGKGLSGVPMRIAGTPPMETFLSAHMPERFLDRDAVLTAPDGSFEFTELYDSVFTVTARPPGAAAVVLEGVAAGSEDLLLTAQ
jgi:hypothetical protein